MKTNIFKSLAIVGLGLLINSFVAPTVIIKAKQY